MAHGRVSGVYAAYLGIEYVPRAFASSASPSRWRTRNACIATVGTGGRPWQSACSPSTFPGRHGIHRHDPRTGAGPGRAVGRRPRARHRRDTVPDFQSPAMHDELRYVVRNELMQDIAERDAHLPQPANETALPMRDHGLVPAGQGRRRRGGALERPDLALPALRLRHPQPHLERYGARHRRGLHHPGLGRHLRRARAALRPLRVSLRHLRQGRQPARARIQAGGNPFEGPRSREYPDAADEEPYAGALFAQGGAQSSATTRSPQPSANMTQPYTNPEGLSLRPCTYLRLLRALRLRAVRQGEPADHDPAGAARSSPNFELRTARQVTPRDPRRSREERATGVTYVDSRRPRVRAAGRAGPARRLCAQQRPACCCSRGIGKPYDPATGEGGRRAATTPTRRHGDVNGVLRRQDVVINPFMGAGALRHGDRRLQRRQFRSLGARLHRRRLYRRDHDRRPADRVPSRRRPARRAGGCEWKQAVRAVLQPHGQWSPPRLLACHARQLSRPRSDLQGRLRPAAAAHDLRLSRERLQMSRYVTDKAAEIGQGHGRTR